MLTQIPGYEVIDVLGHGASSTIFAVRDAHDDQVYALKKVLRKSSVDQKFIEQALTEYNVPRRFNHPVLRKSFKVIRKRRLFKTTELLVLMELIDGRTLERSRSLPISELVDIFISIADGIDAMHRMSYIHCDLKPNNIMLTTSGKVKIIDFGQSCPVDSIKHRIQGTPDYIAPEQVLRQKMTARTDIFNLGATMYWCLTNKHIPTLIPKKNEQSSLVTDMKESMKASLQLTPPIELNPEIPAALNALVMVCAKLEPIDRPQSVRDLISRLEIVKHQLGNGQQSCAT